MSLPLQILLQDGTQIVKGWGPDAMAKCSCISPEMPPEVKAARERITARCISRRAQATREAVRRDNKVHDALEWKGSLQELLRMPFYPGTLSECKAAGLEEPQQQGTALALIAWTSELRRHAVPRQQRTCKLCGGDAACCGCHPWTHHAGVCLTGVIASCIMPGPSFIMLDAEWGCIEVQLASGHGAPFTDAEVRASASQHSRNASPWCSSVVVDQSLHLTHGVRHHDGSPEVLRARTPNCDVQSSCQP